MGWLRAWFSRLAAVLARKNRHEREMNAEIESHLQMHTEDNVRTGMSPERARREALLKLGGVEQTKQSYRERRGLPFLEVLRQDLRFGARMLRKNLGFTLVAVLTLALGIAANATIFSFVNAVVYKRPPVHDPDRVLVVYGTSPKHNWGANLAPVSAPNYFTWKRDNRVFADLAAVERYVSVNLTGAEEPERVDVIRVTANYFPVVGVAPELGRAFTAEEDRPGHNHVALLDYRFWERKFGADPNIVGKTVRLNGEQHTIIGVLPKPFQMMSFHAQMWLPLVLEESQRGKAARETRTLFLVGRLNPSAGTAQAQADLSLLGAVAAQTFPEAENGWGAGCLTLREFGIEEFNADAAMVILLAAVGCVLLIACANIAGLLLARATGRGKEMAVRIAIGAGRMRVVRQLLTEALLIAALGAAAGTALAVAGTQLLHQALSFNEEIAMLDMGMDWRVLSFTTAIAMFSALLFGLAPALRALAVEVFPTLKNDSATASAGRKKSRGRSVLVAAEIALAVVLLSGSGLLIKAFVEELRQNLGFRPEQLLTAQITLPDSRYKEPAKQLAFYRQLAAKLAVAPGVVSVAITNNLPAAGAGFLSFVQKGQESLPLSDHARARYYVVSPRYFETIQGQVLAGRAFTETDDASSPPVALVSEKFVERFFPKGDALGEQILIESGDALGGRWREIVGIVRDVKSWPLNFGVDPEIYEPFAQHPSGEMAVVVRGIREPDALAPSLREAVASIDKDQPIAGIISMPNLLANEAAPDFIFGRIMAIFAALALLLSGIGICGLIAFTVGQRRQEIGIRIALGAEKRNIARIVLQDGLKLTSVGAGIGMLGAFALPRIFQAVFYDFHVAGGWLFAAVPCVIGIIALLACYLPARRAARVDPIVALRYE
jgi:predicted permease